MREKKCLPKTIEKYVEFLHYIKEHSLPYKPEIDLNDIIKLFKINKTILRALKELSIIDTTDCKTWEYLSFNPDKTLALSVLNYILEIEKKQKVVLLPGFTESVALLQKISEKMDTYVTQTRVFNQGAKNAPKEVDMFAEQNQKFRDRVSIAKHIASGVYQQFYEETVTEPFNIYNSEHCHHLNNQIVLAADDLLSKLYAK
jgi:hypothetical protein